MASRWDELGQQLERAVDPLGFDIRAATHPWEVHPDLHPDNRRNTTESQQVYPVVAEAVDIDRQPDVVPVVEEKVQEQRRRWWQFWKS